MSSYEILDDFEQVARCGEYDYSWTEGILWRHKTTNLLLWGTTGGCSCNSYEENIEAEDLILVESWQDAVDLARDDGFTDAEIADFVAEVSHLPASCVLAGDSTQQATPRGRLNP